MNNIFLSNESVIELLLRILNIGQGDISSSTYHVSSVVLSVSLVLFLGFLLTRITKLFKLPNVTAYILAGILIGPNVLNIIPKSFIENTDFLSDIALAFIAFSTGEFFKFDTLKKSGPKVIFITLFESLMSFVLVFVLCRFVFRIQSSFSLVLAALSSATAPASTMMTIKQTGAKGEYVNTLLEVVALDDVVALVLYSISISFCIAIESGNNHVTFAEVGLPIIYNMICLLIGFVCGFLLRFLITKKRTTDNRLIIAIAVLFLFCGICTLFGQSPLLGCMAIGAVYTNSKVADEKLFKQLNYFSPPIMLLFFVRSGMNFDFNSFKSGSEIGTLGIPLIVVAVAYFIIRIGGKYFGSFLGAAATKSNKKIRNFLGFGLIPQAGVAIGLASMGARTFIDAGYLELGTALTTIILPSSILYELIGPAMAKAGLYLSGSYSHNLDLVQPLTEALDNETAVDRLIKQIKMIEEEHRMDTSLNEDAEQAFTEAANEYENEFVVSRRQDFINRRR